MKLSEMKANPDNPRRISQKQLEMLQKSLDQFGELNCLVFNETSGQVVSGHQRLKTLPPGSNVVWERVFDQPTKTGTTKEGFVDVNGERFKIRAVAWDTMTEKAANIAANQHGGEFVHDALAKWVEELAAEDMDLDLLGFSDEELQDLLGDQSTGGKTDEDAVPEVKPDDKRVRPGDLFILGEHRLLCGDSTKAEDIKKLMGEAKASVWLSDPPYGINHVETSQEKGQSKGYGKIENDDLADTEFQAFIFSAIKESLPYMKDGFAFYMWHAMKMQGYTAAAAAAAANILFHRQIIWVKPQLVFGRGHYHWRHELCLMGWLKGNEPPFYGERNQTTIWEIARENDKIHPTQKPVAIWEPSILNHTMNGEIIYEPFSGSGSNLIACEKLSRKCFGLELSPQYVSVILDRWAQFTGKDPVREDGTKWSEIK